MAETREIPEGWIETHLGDLIDIKHGFAFKGDLITDTQNDSILLTPGNFVIGGGWKDWKKYYSWNEIPNDYILSSWDMVLTMTDLSKNGDTLWYPAFIPSNPKNRYLHNQRIGLIKIKNTNLDSRYLYWKLRTKEYQKSIVNSATWSTVRHTSPGRIREYKFILPPLSEQQSIARILSSFDDKIELLRKQNETLEKTASTLFSEWFGKYRIDDELPEGWAFGKLTDIATFLNGLALQRFPPESEKECLPVIKIRELKAGITEQSDKASENIDPKYVIKAGDVLFSWSWSLEVGIWHHQPWALNQHLFKVSSEKYPKWFYYFWTRRHLPWFQDIAAHKATTMGHIQRGHLDMATVVIPDSDSLSRYGNAIEPLFEKTLLNALEIQRLGSIRDILLPKLMSGGIRTN